MVKSKKAIFKSITSVIFLTHSEIYNYIMLEGRRVKYSEVKVDQVTAYFTADGQVNMQ